MGPDREVAALRVVHDTNVVLSALLFNSGALVPFRDSWRNGRIRPLASRNSTEELIKVLAYPKFRLSTEERKELLHDYLPYCETVAISEPPPSVPECRDPSDHAFLELALAGRADAVVTGDKDLLTIQKLFAIPILQPAEFLRRIGQAQIPRG